MTPYVRKFIERYAVPAIPVGTRILELGSLNVNGTIRDLFEGHCEEYIGIDLRDGVGVDEVMPFHDLSYRFGWRSFGAVICLETLEHDPHFWETLQNIRFVLNKGGIFVVSVPDFQFIYHAEPKDYWRFSRDSVFEVLMYGFRMSACEEYEGGIGAVGALQ